MQIDWSIAFASVIVGFTVGLTGMGGGALMTPILLIFFGVTPTAAVSSDLVAAMVMKPVGGGVHIRRKTVRWELVKWLCVGSIPAAFAGVLLLHATGDSAVVENTTRIFLGVTLILAAAAMVLKASLQARRSAQAREGRRVTLGPGGSIRVLIPITLLIGAVGGMLVGLTSVGSGSIVIVCLMLTYPTLRGAQLVGTDLVQAVPLVTAAALAHILVGDFELGLTTSILIGAVPAVYVGARLSSKAPDGIIRPALVFVLLASALKLLDVPTPVIGVALLAGTLVGLPVWGAVDAAAHPQTMWDSAGLSRRGWIRWQAFGAPIGIGFAVAAAYFAKTRPQLRPATLSSDDGDSGVLPSTDDAPVVS
ncbi:MAG: sulfite exporter TauE/SafE family protein [Actinomycetota bacterium]